MKKTFVFLAFLCLTGSIYAQKKTTTSATISFDATTAKDALPKAENKTVIGSIDTQTGAVAFEAAVKNFSFSNPMMQDHFNGDKWFNSNKYPVFLFTGKIENPKKVKFATNGTYKVKVNGELKIKDITKKAKINGTITVVDGKIRIASDFSIRLSDYNISGTPIEAGKVHKEPKIRVAAEF
ncbi:MAG: YceI family protein [Chitinophagaceae bacterium]